MPEKYSLPARPKHHTIPTLNYTHCCAGGNGGEEEGKGAAVQELEQDIPSVLMTRPVTPVTRKTDVLQKVSRWLILQAMKADSLDVIFSSVFILC